MEISVQKFLADKKKLEDEGFSFKYVFESHYLRELASNYEMRREGLDAKLSSDLPSRPKDIGNFLMISHVQKKFEEPLEGVKLIHTGSEDGFSPGEIALIETFSTDESTTAKSKDFIRAMSEIISNREVIPDKTVLLLTSESHHTIKTENKKFQISELGNHSKTKVQKKAAIIRGQKMITNYFKNVKNQPIEQKPKPHLKLLVEQKAQDLRGDNVKILWFPKKHFELNPSKYVEVFLSHDISNHFSNNPEEDLKAGCKAVVDFFANAVWRDAVDQTKRCESFYREIRPTDAANNDETNDSNETLNFGELLSPDHFPVVKVEMTDLQDALD